MWGRRFRLPFLSLFTVLLQAQSSFPALAKQASEARDANHLDQAANLYQKALALRPAWAEGWFSLGTIQYDQNNYQSADMSFSRAVQADPKVGTPQVMLGLCEFELGHDESALAHLQNGLRLGIADNPQLRNVALFHEAVLQQRTGKFEAALQTFYPLCSAGVQSDQLITAISLAALHLRASDSSVPSVGHAECLAAQKQFEQARTDYRALVQRHPNFPNIHYAFGRFLLLIVHDPAAAIAQFEEEIKNQPSNPLARLQIAAAEYQVDSPAGLPYAEAAVKLDPNIPLGHYLLGLLLEDTGQDNRAIPELELARKSFPTESGIYYALGKAYAHAGRTQDAAQARAVFKRLKDQPGPSLLPAR